MPELSRPLDGQYSGYRGSNWKSIRRQAMKRDGYKCRHCGKKKGLTVHHISKYSGPEYNNLENLITLCRSCHNLHEKSEDRQTDKLLGRSGGNRGFGGLLKV